jgi:Tol biopolymer transport system component
VASASTATVPIDGSIARLDLSADGSTLAFSTQPNFNRWATYLADVTTGALSPLAPVDAAGQPVIRGPVQASADGSRIATVGCESQQLYNDCFTADVDVATGAWSRGRSWQRGPWEFLPPLEPLGTSADGGRALYNTVGPSVDDFDAGTAQYPAESLDVLEYSESHITADGRYVSFLVEAPPNGDGTPDIVVRDLATGSLVNATPFGHSWAGFGMVTADGSTVVFSGAVADGVGIHAYDVATGTSELALVPFEVRDLDASADGRRIALTRQEPDGRSSVWLLDRDAATLTQLSADADNTPADGSSYRPSISADGTTVAFLSEATNLSPDDTTPDADAYVVTLP